MAASSSISPPPLHHTHHLELRRPPRCHVAARNAVQRRKIYHCRPSNLPSSLHPIQSSSIVIEVAGHASRPSGHATADLLHQRAEPAARAPPMVDTPVDATQTTGALPGAAHPHAITASQVIRLRRRAPLRPSQELTSSPSSLEELAKLSPVPPVVCQARSHSQSQSPPSTKPCRPCHLRPWPPLELLLPSTSHTASHLVGARFLEINDALRSHRATHGRPAATVQTRIPSSRPSMGEINPAIQEINGH